MNIQFIEKKTGLTKRMIRHYEDMGLIKPKRDENNYRDYSHEDVDHLLCIKAMRELGFSIEDIGKIFTDGKTEEVLRRHLYELLSKQKEAYCEQQKRIKTIKHLLNAKNDELIEKLLNQIAVAYSPGMKNEAVDDLDDFLRKHHVVHGHIATISELAKVASFGSQNEFKIESTVYTTYQSAFEENMCPRASISMCKQLYSYVILFTNSDSHHGGDFHKMILEQFSQTWSQFSWELSFNFDALTEDLSSLEKIFSLFDLAVCITARNSQDEKLCLVLPAQPLVVYLSQKEGVDYNTADWLEK